MTRLFQQERRLTSKKPSLFALGAFITARRMSVAGGAFFLAISTLVTGDCQYGAASMGVFGRRVKRWNSVIPGVPSGNPLDYFGGKKC